MRRRALHDPLTGLPNRTLVIDRLAHALAARDRHPGTVAVVLLDIDQFKVVNDSLGHDAGDQLLLAVAPRLAGAVRPGDTVGRLGGDEFVVVGENVADAAGRRGRSPRASSRAFAEPFVARRRAAPSDRERRRRARRRRDARARRALAQRRHRHVPREGARPRRASRPSTRSCASARSSALQLERALRDAVPRDELALDFQPIVALGRPPRRGMRGARALAAPRSAGSCCPSSFIGVAEDAGLIGAIGAWVLREACAAGRRWRARHAARAARQPLAAAGHRPRRCRRRSPRRSRPPGCRAECLVLEITESSLMERGRPRRPCCASSRRLGVGLVLDDFGTGWSSLSPPAPPPDHRPEGRPLVRRRARARPQARAA